MNKRYNNLVRIDLGFDLSDHTELDLDVDVYSDVITNSDLILDNWELISDLIFVAVLKGIKK